MSPEQFMEWLGKQTPAKAEPPSIQPLYEQPDAVIREVLGDLTVEEIKQYRADCRFRASL